MKYKIENAVDRLEAESNDHQGRLDALNMLAKIFLEGMKVQDLNGYEDLKELCGNIAISQLTDAKASGDKNFEEKSQAFHQEVEILFSDMDELQDTH